MRLRLLFIIALLASLSAYGQSIRGRLIGSNHQPVEEAIITLLRPDSSFVAHSISGKDGSFAFTENIQAYILNISHLSYETLTIASDKSELGDIQLRVQEQALGEVVVEAKRPVVKMKAGQLSFNAPSLLAKRPAHSAYDLLRSVPGLQVSESTGVAIHGGLGGTTILINGQQKQYPGGVEEYLKTLDVWRVSTSPT